MTVMGRLIARWTWSILALSLGYGLLIGLACLALGMPQWPLWGILTAILVLIPFFGPLLAGLILVVVAAITGQGWGPPLAILSVFVVLQLVEGYVIQPRLYGRTVHFDSLTVLLGVLLFGFLWGPLGFIAALPVLVLIRGFVEATPGTEALAALLGDEA
jgi:predicted PurR-regulated permease PerM